MASGSEWRTLYRCLLRAAPRVVSGNRKQALALAGKIRQGFDENMASNRSVEDLAALYRQGHNTLGFLKLARELGSMERRVVSSIMYLEAERDASDKKPSLFKRKFSPLQQRVHLETQGSFDQAVANLARDLDIILPPYQTKRSLEWIPRLNHLYKNDSNWGRALRQHD